VSNGGGRVVSSAVVDVPVVINGCPVVRLRCLVMVLGGLVVVRVLATAVMDGVPAALVAVVLVVML